MTIIIPETEDILTEYLRGKLTDPRSRSTNDTDSFTATAGQTSFTLSYPRISNINSVTVNTVAQTLWEDYYADFSSTAGKIIFDTGLSLSDAVAVDYDYIADTKSNWIFPQMANTNPCAKTDYPRIAVKTISTEGIQTGSGEDTAESVSHIQLHTFTDKNSIAIDGVTTGGKNAARKLCRYAYTAIKNNWRDDFSPILFNFDIINEPVDLPIDEDKGVYRSVADFNISIINQGESR